MLVVGTECFCFCSKKFRFHFTVSLGPAFPESVSIHYFSYLLEQSIDRGSWDSLHFSDPRVTTDLCHDDHARKQSVRLLHNGISVGSRPGLSPVWMGTLLSFKLLSHHWFAGSRGDPSQTNISHSIWKCFNIDNECPGPVRDCWSC